jgi:hypothetical protein
MALLFLLGKSGIRSYRRHNVRSFQSRFQWAFLIKRFVFMKTLPFAVT